MDLTLSPEIIKTEKFKKLVKNLDPDALHYLKLGFKEGTPQDEINAALQESGIADLASYPITIDYPWSTKLDKTFIETIINNVHRYKSQPKKVPILKETDEDDPNLPRIKLKEIISNPELSRDSNLVSIDVAIEAEAQVEVEVEAEVAIEAQLTFYTGPKYDYAEFIGQKFMDNNLAISVARNKQGHRIDRIQEELFAQLPCAIQYVTPEASKIIHADSSQIMSFNKDNPPQPGMLLHKSPEGALILDYAIGHEGHYNAFTPINRLRYEEEEPAYFDAALLPDDFQECKSWPFIHSDKKLPFISERHLVNLYVLHRKEKLRDFIKLFEVANAAQYHQHALVQCIEAVFGSYVCSFSQCAFMVEGTWFEECIQRIKQEKDVAKLACFTSLLTASENARHDLQHTLNAFDVFWDEIKKRCPEKQLGKIKFTSLHSNKEIYTAGIPPVVAMERLLTILQNARDITSQIDYLDNLPPGAFKAYYASAFEGFGMVHKDMDTSWAPNVYNMHYLTEWPSNLTYFKNTFVLFEDKFFYITNDLQNEPIPYTETLAYDGKSLFEKWGKGYLNALKEEKFIQVPQGDLELLTNYTPERIPYNQHAKVYQVDLSTLRDMALKEKVIYYPKFYAYLHRYMGQQKEGISYADFRAQTEACDFQHQGKAIAFALLFFMTDLNYNKNLGISPLIATLKQLKPEVLHQLAETLYRLQGRGIVLNNEEGLILLDNLLTQDPQVILRELDQKRLIITEYDGLLDKFKTIIPSIKKAIKESHIDINQVAILLNTLQNFSEEYQQALFNALKSEPQNSIEPLCERITQLRVAALPPEYIIRYIGLKGLHCDVILERFTKDRHDPILSYILGPDFIGNSADAKKLLDLTADSQSKSKVIALLKNTNILQYIKDPRVLDILAKSYHTLLADQKLTVEEWEELAKDLSLLNNPKDLVKLYKITAPNSLCLFNALKNNRLDKLEREPFGPRDDAKDFDVTEVERVVNESLDWSNDTVYSYKYRKQLMEAFTFVNEIGYKLPIFEGRTAKELSNAEIQAYFLGIKNKSFLQDLPPFQQQLIALSLIREALYRSTGKMAYSTQLIVIIDCLMHKGPLFSNIDTGEGKSLIDVAKDALVWLNSDRVDTTTSSIEDAKRDLEEFAPFLNFLNIPCGQKAITAQSELPDFVSNGINAGTFSQMALFQAKMKMEGKALGKETDVVSLIINESDYSLLEDRTVYRYATQSTQSLSPQAEWIYTAINEFVLLDLKFNSRTTSEQRDVLNLKVFLKDYAKRHNKNSTIVNDISFSQWVQWINAALLVQYKLKENDDFYVAKEQQAVTIRGQKQMSHVVELLMTEGEVKTKVNPGAKFGNSVQQLLYAKLNKDYPDKKFKIEPETIAVSSSNNRNLLESYLNRKNPGVIWGSSATTGFATERKEQHANYNIDFSKIAPHKKKRIVSHDPRFFKNQATLFQAIKDDMASVKPDPKTRGKMIFCQDINSAITLHALLASTHPDNLQLYTGSGDEAACLAKARQGGMITICTAALARNTDIKYDREIGMDVIHTSINSYNLETQITGRTGREGSEGDVYFYFNKQELDGKTKEEIQEKIYQKSLKARAFNEEIYSLLGNVLTQLERQGLQPNKVDFFNNTWAKLSANYEKLYRELQINKAYDREAFIDKIVDELPSYTLNKQEILKALTHQFEANTPYAPYIEQVKLKDCTPPVELSYSLLNKNKTQPLAPAARQGIKDKVHELLKNYENSKTIECHVDYIRYLILTNASQHEIRAIHQECIQEFLDTQAKNPLSWYERLLGYQSKLNKVANSFNYLILFRSLMNVPSSTKGTNTELEIARSTAIDLIKEYQSQWFIHSDREKIAAQLILDLRQVKDLAAMITVLDNCQITLAQEDAKINKNRRWLPHLHPSGFSRLQYTIGGILSLTANLGNEPTNNYKRLFQELDHTDENNKKVIKQQIETSIKLREPSVFFSKVGKPKDQKAQGSQAYDLDLDNALKKISSLEIEMRSLSLS